MGADAPPMRYRPDIDGLRAIAVVAVVLCHMGARGVPGGFLGVDVFFVMSGALIHRDLVARLDAGRLSIPAFYGRRIRRTLPALIVAGLLTACAALTVLLPGEMITLVRSLLASLCSVPNLWFLSQVGYFDADAATKPLLHTWSLGVEEQFYLVAPLLALALRPIAPRGRMGALLAGFAISFGVTLLVARVSPAGAFYLMPTRLFEFAIGAIVAEGWLAPPSPVTADPTTRRRDRVAAELAAAAALCALVASLVLFDASVPHPGWATLPPCVGTAALIGLGTTRRTFATRVLSLKPLVAIGRISYSLYLYHWPILVLAHAADLPTSLPWRLGEGLLMIGAAVLSYRFVEQPFRDPASFWRVRAPVLLPAGGAILAGVCAAILALGGLPGRFPRDVDAIAAYADFRNTRPFREGRCFITSRDEPDAFDREACLAPSTTKPNVLLIGDSHAAHLWTALRDTWPGVNFLQATASGCKPVVGATGETRCTALIRDMFERFLPRTPLDAVVLSALWDDADVAPLRDTLATLREAGQRAIVFGPLPRSDVPMAPLLAHAVLNHDLDLVSHHRLPATEALDARLHAAVAPLATYVSIFSAMCPDICRLFAARDVPMQFDFHHLTPQGAAVLMATIRTRHPRLFDAPRPAQLDLSRE